MKKVSAESKKESKNNTNDGSDAVADSGSDGATTAQAIINEQKQELQLLKEQIQNGEIETQTRMEEATKQMAAFHRQEIKELQNELKKAQQQNGSGTGTMVVDEVVISETVVDEVRRSSVIVSDVVVSVKETSSGSPPPPPPPPLLHPPTVSSKTLTETPSNVSNVASPNDALHATIAGQKNELDELKAKIQVYQRYQEEQIKQTAATAGMAATQNKAAVDCGVGTDAHLQEEVVKLKIALADREEALADREEALAKFEKERQNTNKNQPQGIQNDGNNQLKELSERFIKQENDFKQQMVEQQRLHQKEKEQLLEDVRKTHENEIQQIQQNDDHVQEGKQKGKQKKQRAPKEKKNHQDS